jgi:hypothetical protein
MAVDGSRWQFLGRSPAVSPRDAVDNEFLRYVDPSTISTPTGMLDPDAILFRAQAAVLTPAGKASSLQMREEQIRRREKPMGNLRRSGQAPTLRNAPNVLWSRGVTPTPIRTLRACRKPSGQLGITRLTA